MDSMTDKPQATNGAGGQSDMDDGSDDFRRAFLAGVLGAVVASAGYLIYSRLEDEHKAAVRKTVMKFVEEKVGDLETRIAQLQAQLADPSLYADGGTRAATLGQQQEALRVQLVAAESELLALYESSAA